MLLAIDAGNTNVVFALCEGDAIRYVWRCRTDAARTADEYASWLFPLFQNAGVDFGVVKAAVISSVVPDANYNLLTLCRQRWNCEPLFANKDLVDIKVNLPKPEEAGADRLVNACAVVKDYGSPAIVIDFGTATTFDVVNAKVKNSAAS
jgi:type III pantothenate kinase